jgi:branched-chain amino acid transport system substrate-binding protein
LPRLILYLSLLGIICPREVISQFHWNDSTISIGILLPDPSHRKVVRGAELAIAKANASGGYKGKPFELAVRSAEGLWGAGSKESVSLVYEDHVRAIIGSLDGRNGHLAEQVATKSHLSYIETFATEPTLSQAFVPWFFRVVPNDNQQSAVILRQIITSGGGRIGILSTQEYNTGYAVRSLTKAVARETGVSIRAIELDIKDFQQGEVLDRILSSNLDHLVIPFDASFMTELIKTLRSLKPDLSIYGTLHFTMGIEDRESPWKYCKGVHMLAPLLNPASQADLPDIRSAYVYDAVNLVIHAIRQVGTDREAITNYLSETEYPGITGKISFDELGNRQEVPSLISIQNGNPESH